MVMFKAKFRPMVADRPSATDKFAAGDRSHRLQQQQQQQPQPVPPHPGQQPGEAPPIEKERGPVYPVKEPGPGNPPERAR